MALETQAEARREDKIADCIFALREKTETYGVLGTESGLKTVLPR